MMEREPKTTPTKKNSSARRETSALNKMNEERAEDIVKYFRGLGADISFNGEEFVLRQILEDGKEVEHHILARERLPVTNAKEKNAETKQRNVEEVIEATWKYYGSRGGDEGTYELLQLLHHEKNGS